MGHKKKNHHKINHNANKLISMEISCSACHNKIVVKSDNCSFTAEDNPCELCGTHGAIILMYYCTTCKRTLEIELKSW